MPVFCAVYECLNRPNRENTRAFIVYENVLFIRGKVKKLREKRRKKVACKLASAVDRSRSDNARACKWLI